MDFKLPTREKISNKGTFGKILNISGSHYMPGCAYLSSVAALKTGAGYVALASEENVLDTVSKLAPEVVLSPISKIQEINPTVLLIGCGLSTSDNAKEIFKKVIPSQIPTVIDADGLNILAESNLKLNKITILTPHPKEASRLLNCSLENILINMEKAAKQICEKYNCITVLKSHNTIVTDGEKIYYNTTGNSALAKAGSGDVLAGMIAGLLAQGAAPYDASCLGVYLHGLAGDLAKNDLTEYGVLATDTIRYIPYAIKKLLTGDNI